MLRWIGRLARWTAIAAVLAALLAGGSAALFGSHRIKGMFYTARRAAMENIDSLIPDEVKLRGDLDKLRDEYPRRIAELKSMVESILQEYRDAEKEHRLCVEVIAICDEDLGQAAAAAPLPVPQPGVALIPQRHAVPGSRTSLTWVAVEAVERTRKISELRERYQTRLEAGTTSMELLSAERDRLVAELIDLEGEYDQFLAELKAMEREIDVLRNNERLLELARRRERVERVDTAGWLRSLADLKRAIARHRNEQEEKLRSFRVHVPACDYEARAKLRVSRQELRAPAPELVAPF